MNLVGKVLPALMAVIAMSACSSPSEPASEAPIESAALPTTSIDSAPLPETPPDLDPPAPAPTAEPTPAPVVADPSFDCGKASSQVERSICRSTTLAALDRRLATAYAAALSGGTDDPALVKQLQAGFLRERNKCATDSCIADTYRARINQLKPGPAASGSCEAEIGRAAANALVRQCIDASPATHPPCNIANRCELIRDEITRGCGLMDAADRPAYCTDRG